MLLLAIDTSTAACAVALVEAGGPDRVDVLAESAVVDARRHGELLAPTIEAVLAQTGTRPAQLGALAVGAGPGPFTSLRVGIVTAAALADAVGISAYGRCSLDALATAAGHGRLAVATDARRREVYWAVYDEAQRLEGPAVDRPAAVGARLRAAGVPRVVGEGGHRYAESFGDLLDAAGPRHPPAAVLARLVAPTALRGEPAGPLVPRYLRRPDVAAPHPPKPVSA